MDKYELDRLLQRRREEPHIRYRKGQEEPIDVMAPLRPLPFWARMGVSLSLLWSAWVYLTTPKGPDEPQKAVWVTLLLLVLTVVLSELLRPKPNIEDARPAGLGDFNFPTATEARVVPLIWGRVKVEGPNVVWYGDKTQQAMREKVKTGLWSKKRITTGFKYKIGIQFGICRGPNVELLRWWVGDKQVWESESSPLATDGASADFTDDNFFGGDDLGNGGLSATIVFYTGSKTQSVDTYLAQHQQVGAGNDTPRYSGSSYVVAHDYQNTDYGAYIGNSTTIKPWEFEVQRYPAAWSGQTTNQEIVGVECNPMNVLYEILTDTEWGFGFPNADIDVGTPGTTSFDTAAATLLTEGNGFSMALTSVKESADIIEEIERQIDGVVFLDHQTGKWKVKLARDDYNIDTVPQLTDSNVHEVRDFTRGTFEDTTNQITVRYWKREEDPEDSTVIYYKETFALAQDVGNALTQGGGTITTSKVVPAEVSYPGCKTSALASFLAWRDLRGQAYPLARATFVVNREFWDVSIGDVVAWTNTQLGFSKLAMRVTKIDYGKLQDNAITMTCVQDVFTSATASYGTPEDSLWSPPTGDLVKYPTAQQIAFECPRAIVIRDPDYTGTEYVSKIFAGARQQEDEVGFWITQRNASGSPSGSFADDSQVFGLLRIGKLRADLSAGVANPSSFDIDQATGMDSITSLFEVWETYGDEDLGISLSNLIYIDNGTGDGEFVLVGSATNHTTYITLSNCYRGALDSAQQDWDTSSEVEVYLVFVAAGTGDTLINNAYNVEVRLDAFDSQGRYSDTASPTWNTISFTMAKRTERPYSPALIRYNTTNDIWGTPDLEDSSAQTNSAGCAADIYRRDFTTTDEVSALKSDDSGVDSSHESRIMVYAETATDVFTLAQTGSWATGVTLDNPLFINVVDLMELDGVNRIRIEVETRHNSPVDSTSLTSRQKLRHTKIPDPDLSSLTYLGGNIGLGPSTAYTVTSAGVHTINIGAAMTVANAQYRINGGSWVTIVGTSATTGSLSVSDTIEVRVDNATYAPDPNYVDIDNPSATRVAYGTL